MRVRFFAGAAEAAGVDEASFDGPLGFAELRERLAADYGAELAAVLERCSFLADGIRLEGDAAAIADTATVDVLPPFAGG